MKHRREHGGTAPQGSQTPAHSGADASASAACPAPASATLSRRRVVIIAGVAVVVLLLVALFAMRQCSTPADDGMEPNVVVGTMEGYSDEEIAAMLAKKVDEGMIAFSLNTSMLVEGPDAQTSIKFENPPNNAKLTKLSMLLDETGEQVYQTGYLAPGSYVDADQLDVQLPVGTHACTAYISSYDQETKKYLGEAACAVTVTVTE